ncbi:MAG: FG-GAP-like repeat-containing protein [Thermoguttaceae bacterium]
MFRVARPSQRSRSSQSSRKSGRRVSPGVGSPAHSRTLRFEPMEERTLLSIDFQFHHVLLNSPTGPTLAGPLTVMQSMTPAQIRTAYGLDQLTGDGTGQTVAIVDAYDNPNIASDLQVFCTKYGLPAADFTKLNQSGVAGSYPSGDTGWGMEEALDVEWVHAIAPGAKIILFEANSNYDADLMAAVNTARNYAGVTVVSMSWGGNESSSDTGYNSYFTTPSGHAGVTFVASTGDSGAPGGYPAYSPNVLAVGGTTLSINTSTSAYLSETGWNGSGGGISSYEAKPAYQSTLATQSSTKRTIPDVAFDADPSSGVAVYDTYGYSGWSNVGGTSLSAPCWGGLLAITNQLRVANGSAALNPYGNPTETQTLLYGLAGTTSAYNPSGDYHDITSGSNGYSAAAGYDLVTGLGSPVANKVVLDLAGVVVPPTIVGTTPSLSSGTVATGTLSLAINFSKAVIGADNAANYQLQRLVADGLLGTSDDTIVGLAVSYSGTTAILSFPPLQENIYRLTVRDTITDSQGNPLQGDGETASDWTSDFVVVTAGTASFAAATTVNSGGTSPQCVAVGDFNNDGKPDMAVTNRGDSTVGVLLNNGSGGFSTAATLSTGGSGPFGIVTADFNGDGNLDLAVANSNSTTIGVLLGNGKGSFWTATTFTGGPYPCDLAVADFNGDGKPDIAATNRNSGSVSILLGTGSGFATPVSYSTGGPYPYGLITADFNGDGKADVAVANMSSSSVGVLLGNGDGTLKTVTTFAVGSSYYLATGDFNSDGKTDLAVANSNGTVGILIGDGSGSFATGSTFSTGGSSPIGVVAGDFNGDGKTDLAVANSGSANVGILLGDGGGSFASAVTLNTAGSPPYRLAAADLNGDGKPDLAVANSNSATVGLLLNTSAWSALTLTSANGLPFDVAVGGFGVGQLIQGYKNAFDGDGRLMVGGVSFQPSASSYTLADGGQTIATASAVAAGLTVTREVTVPKSGSQDFARTIDTFTNSSGSTINTTVTIIANLGSDAGTTVFGTSDGNTTLSTSDLWIGTDDATDGSGAPAVVHYIHGPGAAKPIAVRQVGDNVEWTYNLTVPAGQTVQLGYFTIVCDSRADAVAAANALVTPTGFGGQAAAFLTSAELQSLVNFVNTNHAPTLTPAGYWLASTNEDTPSTVPISTLVSASRISDSDGLSLGIAVTGTVGHGTWSYSLDGTNYVAIGAVSDASALLLPSSAKLRYTPDAKNGELATISYRGWDQTYGTPGTLVDTSVSGGTTAFSVATDTASLSVISVNDAPVLTVTHPSLGATTKDLPITIALAGTFINHGDGTTTITDVDNGAIIGGIALSATTGFGVWSYSLDGATFTPVGSVSGTAALLLPTTAMLRYTPDGVMGGTAKIGYYAWDATSGAAGNKIDLSSYAGGTTAISLDWDLASLRINDAPTLTPASPTIGMTDENTTFTVGLSGTFINHGEGTTTISDVDAGSVVGGIALTGATGNGVWSYSLDGTTFTAVGAVAADSALLLPRTAQLRYAPDLKNGETATITYCGWDVTSGTAATKVSTTTNGGTTAFSTATDTASLIVTDVNDAPALTAAAPFLGLTNQTATHVYSLAEVLVNHGTGSTTVTDVDTADTVGGIAVWATAGHGTWAYSLDGVSFLPVGAVSATSALLLPSTAQIAYTPDPLADGTTTISYRAWDATSGTPGGTADTSVTGGTTAFSTASDTATLTVDFTPPTISGTSPSLAGGTLPVGVTTLALTFSETVIGGGTAANYQLKSVGADGLLGTTDDVIVPLTVSYSGTTATLTFAGLPENVYRLTVSDTITDSATNKLDGDADGTAGGACVRDFVVVTNGSLVMTQVAAVGSGGGWPQGIAVGDFNGDGKPDIAATNASSGAVGILLGNGLGGLGTATAFSTGGSHPVGVAAADFNGDGKLDLAIANGWSDTVGILLGKGDGTFPTVVTYGAGSCPMDVATGDFNCDGKLDLAVADNGSGVVSILLGNGNGTFGSAKTYSCGGTGCYGLAVADLNGDGKLDLAVANSSPTGTVGVLLGTGSGAFGVATAFNSGGASPRTVAAGDFNGDGKLDLAVANYGSGKLGILQGDGSGGFGTAATFSAGSSPQGLAVADFNGDGKLDLATTNWPSDTISVLLGNGSGGLGTAIACNAGAWADDIATADFNGDGHIDLAVVNGFDNTAGILLNYTGPAPVTLKSLNGLPFDIATGSFGAGEIIQGSSNAFDGDGRLLVGGVALQTASSYTTVDGGRTIITGAGTAAGLTVSREVTVPGTGGQDFARTIDTFTNSTGAAITTTVTVVGNLGSDAATAIFATSNGYTTFEASDQWIGTDDADGSGSPAVIHYIHGPAGLQPTSVSLSGDNISWTYNITVAAGETVQLAYFTIVNATRAGAIAAANVLVGNSGFGGQAAAYLTTADVAGLANFQFPPQAVVTLDSHSPATNAVLTANATASDYYGSPVTLTYVWRVNGTIVKTTSTTALSDTLDLSVDGNGNSGDAIAVEVTPGDGRLTGLTVSDTATVAPATIAGRHVFYNNSYYDGNNAAADVQDDNAIATDKTALLPGQKAAFANYTSYSRGLNGVMVDIADAIGPITASDFEFKVGNNSDPSTWTTAPAPGVTYRTLPNGSIRVTLIWADNAIQKEWLQVKVLATAGTDLAAPDVFYFGNAVGESGDSTGNAWVNATDAVAVGSHIQVSPRVGVTNRYDYNRDGRVNATDAVLVGGNVAIGPNALQLVTPADNQRYAELLMAALGSDEKKSSIAPALASLGDPASLTDVPATERLRADLATSLPAAVDAVFQTLGRPDVC